MGPLSATNEQRSDAGAEIRHVMLNSIRLDLPDYMCRHIEVHNMLVLRR